MVAKTSILKELETIYEKSGKSALCVVWTDRF